MTEQSTLLTILLVRLDTDHLRRPRSAHAGPLSAGRRLMRMPK